MITSLAQVIQTERDSTANKILNLFCIQPMIASDALNFFYENQVPPGAECRILIRILGISAWTLALFLSPSTCRVYFIDTLNYSDVGIFVGFTVPWWAGLSFAVLEELRWPTGAHTQALVCGLPGLLVEADDDSLLHPWDKRMTGSHKGCPKNQVLLVWGSNFTFSFLKCQIRLAYYSISSQSKWQDADTHFC